MDNMQLVKDKIVELGDLYKRMDITAKLVLLDPYEFKDWQEKVTKAISITRNTPAWQAYVMVNKLSKLKWQTVVESTAKMAKSKIALIERFSNDIWAQVDEFLGDEGGLAGGINAWNADQVVKRGPIGARWWLYFDKQGNLIIDCLPLDMRWCPFELNEWYCNITWLNAEVIKRQFKGEKDFNTEKLTGTNLEMRDFWDKDKEEIYVGDVKIGEKENEFKVPPFVVTFPSVGSTFRDKGYLKWSFEDVLFLNRDLYDAENQIASIAQTLSLASVLPSYEQVDKEIPVSKPVDKVAGIGEQARADVAHTLIPRGDLNNALMKATQDLRVDLDHGGVTDTEAGNNTDPGRTALYITTQNSLADEKLGPRKDALATFKLKSIRMIFDFYVKLAGMKKTQEVKLGIHGMKHSYSAEKLGDPATYRIMYIPLMVSREQNIANTVVGLSQRGWLPDEFILQDTMQMSDPDGIIRKMNMQKAREADPTIGWVEMAESYLEESQELEGDEAEDKKLLSMMLIDNVVITRRQRMAPTPPPQLPQPTEVKPNTGGLKAIAGPGGNGARGKTEVPMLTKEG